MDIEDVLWSGSGGPANMDASLNYDSPEFLTSDFFESVLSLENNLDDGFLSNFEDDVNLSSDASHSDEVLSPQSLYSESDKNSTYSTENLDDSISLVSSVENCETPVLMPLLEPITNVTIEDVQPTPIINTTKKQPTKILIQNPSNKKFIAKPMINATQMKKIVRQPQGKTHILKVQQVANNCRPVLFPLSVKSIKILNSSADVAALTGSLKRRKVEPVQAVLSSEDDDSNLVSPSGSQYPPLSLTNEEKRLLAKEGIQLPTHHPLTKNEERELKRIRRKIRNKISAQDSRKRKKEYVDGLEEKVKRGSEENKNLLQRVKELQRQNRTLIAHVNKLQALICKSTTTKATPSTCLMVVLLSALLVSLPNMRLFENKQMATEQEQVSIRRSLLSSPQAMEDDLNMEEFLVFKEDEAEFEGKFGDDVAADIENSTEKELNKILDDMGKKYEGLLGDKDSDTTTIFGRMVEQVKKFLDKDPAGFFGKKEYGGFHNKNGFIEPDIDEEEGPPSKRAKHQEPDMIHNENVVSTTLFNGNSKNK